MWSLLRWPSRFHPRVSKYPNGGEKGGEGKGVYLHNIKKNNRILLCRPICPGFNNAAIRLALLCTWWDRWPAGERRSVYGTVFMMAPRASSLLSTTASLLHQVHGPYSIFPSVPGTFLSAIFFSLILKKRKNTTSGGGIRWKDLKNIDCTWWQVITALRNIHWHCMEQVFCCCPIPCRICWSGADMCK